MSSNNWTEIIVTSLSSGTAVAFVNHFLQARRKKQEIKFENKSVLIREKIKFIDEVNETLNFIADTLSKIFNKIDSYIVYFIENDVKIKNEKLKDLEDDIDNNELKIRNSARNLNLYLNYFPKVKEFAHEYLFLKYIDDLLIVFKEIVRDFSNPNMVRKIFGENYSNFNVTYMNKVHIKFESFNVKYTLVLGELDKEGEKIYKYLDND
ncbi:hypothetical protein HMPREF2905_10700 [Staphylococcus sp. HMSC078E07]|nr:hypothetical protein HMPREF2905_10700 [Staphylococcus sp. HMSC078E07]